MELKLTQLQRIIVDALCASSYAMYVIEHDRANRLEEALEEMTIIAQIILIYSATMTFLLIILCL